MLQTIEVEVDASGHVRALEPVGKLPVGRALLTFLPSTEDDGARLSERALAEDWLRPEEEAAWAHLQPGK
jgi:hypothetical protein